ncbi:MAG: peptidoglycan-associated lipoprotein Pal [Cellvibrionales bacterium]|nr:peptidoglycan-associated lipoprotein Pal [Cellvibrionales bacterium]
MKLIATTELAKLAALAALLAGLAACAAPGPVDSTGAVDEVIEPVDAAAEPAAPEPVAAPTDPEAGLASVFYFEFDKSSLTAQARRDLNAYAQALGSSPRAIRLEGHADERGTREYNIALGERRAKSVANYLIGAGVSPGLIETISYGEERPAVAASNESAWSQNRRVELR